MSNNEILISITADSDKAQDSVQMLADLIGVTVPEGVSKLLASCELIAPALDAAFVPLAVISLGAAILDATEKVKQHAEQLQQLASNALNSAISIHEFSEQIRISNLQLEDQINVLQKKPAQNGMKITLAEAVQEADKLTASIQRAIDADSKLLESQSQSLLSKIFLGSSDEQKIANEVAEKYASFKAELQQLDEQTKRDEADNQKEVANDKQKYKDELDALTSYLKEAQGKIDAARKDRETFYESGHDESNLSSGGSDRIPGMPQPAAMAQAASEFRDVQNLVTTLRGTLSAAGEAAQGLAQNLQLKGTKENIQQQNDLLKNQDAIRQKQNNDINQQQQLEQNLNNLAISAQNTQKQLEAENVAAIGRKVKVQIQGYKDMLEAADLSYQGQSEAARIDEKTQEQLIEQRYLKGEITQQQEIALVAKAKQAEITEEIKYLRVRENLWTRSLKEKQEIENKIAKSEAQSAQAGTKAVTDAIKVQQQQYQQLFRQIGSAFTNNVLGMLEGTETVAQAFSKMYSSLLQSLANYLAQKVEKKSEDWAIDKLFTQKQADTEISASAGKTYADVFAALASLGPAGVAAAPGAAQSAAMTVIAGAHTIAALAIGTNYVPMDGLAYLHKGEKVIPAGSTGPGYSGGEGNNYTVVVNHTVQAIDSDSFQGTIRKHSNMIANEVTRALKRKRA